MSQINKDYLDHKIFEEIKAYSGFYKSLSYSIMHFVSSGTTAFLNLDTYVFSSMKGTLDSIKLILLEGRINDAYALLRKYHDSVIINAYEIAFLEDNFSIENFIVEKINNWIHGTEKLPSYKTMTEYLRASLRLSEINSLLQKDERYKKLRSRCNDHMHYNLFYYMLINDNKVYIKSRAQFLDKLSEDLRDIFILHFAYVFKLNPHYMSFSDYIDAVDCGAIPEEGSQYFVAPFIQDIFDRVIKPSRNDIADEIKRNLSMQLE